MFSIFLPPHKNNCTCIHTGTVKICGILHEKWTIHSGVELMDFVVVIVMSFSLRSHISYRYILWFISKDRWIWPRKFLRLTPSDYENNKSLKPIGIKSHLLLWQLTLNTHHWTISMIDLYLVHALIRSLIRCQFILINLHIDFYFAFFSHFGYAI